MKKTDTKEKKSFDINNSTAAIEKDEAHKEINGNGKSVDSHLKQESKFADQSADNTLYKYQNENIEYFRRLSALNYLNAHNYIALDIDRDKLRYMTGKVTKKSVQVIDYGVGISNKKNTQDIDQIQQLSDIKSNYGKSGYKVFVSFFSPDITIKQFVLPRVAKTKDLKNAISFKLQAELSGFNEESQWYYKIIDQFTENNSEFFRILTVVVPGDVVTGMMDMLNAAGLKPDILLPRPIAAYNAYLKIMDDIEADILVDISYDTTHIYFITDKNLEYTRDIASGAANFETAVHDKRDKILHSDTFGKKDGIGENGALKPEMIREALHMRLKILQSQQNPALQLFKNELDNSIEYFNKLQPKKNVKRIFLTGYGIQKEGLVSFLKKNMKLPVFVLTPRLNNLDKDILKFGEYFTAIGSAFTQKDTFDLIPNMYKKRKVYKRLNYSMITLIILMVIGLGYINIFMNKSTADMSIQLADLRMQYDALHPVELEYNKTNQEIASLKMEQNNLLGFMKKKSPLIEAMKFLSNETPAQIVLSDFSVTTINNKIIKKKRNLRNLKANKKEITKEKEPETGYSMQFTGNVISDYLLSDITLINYVDHLKNLNVFKSVDLVYKDKKSSKQSMRFEIKIIL